MIMRDFKSTILTCTPSYSLFLAEAAREENIDFKTLSLKSGCFGAEPWSEALRAEIAVILASGEVDDLHDTIEDTRAGGASLADAAAQYGLPLHTVAAVDSAGNNEDGLAIAALPSPDLIPAAWTLRQHPKYQRPLLPFVGRGQGQH